MRPIGPAPAAGGESLMLYADIVKHARKGGTRFYGRKLSTAYVRTADSTACRTLPAQCQRDERSVPARTPRPGIVRNSPPQPRMKAANARFPGVARSPLQASDAAPSSQNPVIGPACCEARSETHGKSAGQGAKSPRPSDTDTRAKKNTTKPQMPTRVARRRGHRLQRTPAG